MIIRMRDPTQLSPLKTVFSDSISAVNISETLQEDSITLTEEGSLLTRDTTVQAEWGTGTALSDRIVRLEVSESLQVDSAEQEDSQETVQFSPVEQTEWGKTWNSDLLTPDEFGLSIVASPIIPDTFTLTRQQDGQIPSEWVLNLAYTSGLIPSEWVLNLAYTLESTPSEWGLSLVGGYILPTEFSAVVQESGVVPVEWIRSVSTTSDSSVPLETGTSLQDDGSVPAFWTKSITSDSGGSQEEGLTIVGSSSVRDEAGLSLLDDSGQPIAMAAQPFFDGSVPLEYLGIVVIFQDSFIPAEYSKGVSPTSIIPDEIGEVLIEGYVLPLETSLSVIDDSSSPSESSESVLSHGSVPAFWTLSAIFNYVVPSEFELSAAGDLSGRVEDSLSVQGPPTVAADWSSTLSGIGRGTPLEFGSSIVSDSKVPDFLVLGVQQDLSSLLESGLSVQEPYILPSEWTGQVQFFSDSGIQVTWTGTLTSDSRGPEDSHSSLVTDRTFTCETSEAVVSGSIINTQTAMQANLDQNIPLDWLTTPTTSVLNDFSGLIDFSGSVQSREIIAQEVLKRVAEDIAIASENVTQSTDRLSDANVPLDVSIGVVSAEPSPAGLLSSIQTDTPPVPEWGIGVFVDAVVAMIVNWTIATSRTATMIASAGPRIRIASAGARTRIATAVTRIRVAIGKGD